MIGYVTLGTNDLAKAASFYDGLLSVLGAKRVMEYDRFIAWSTGQGTPMLLLMKPYDDQPATVGNGVMVALAAGSQDNVNALHAKAMSLGGADEGAPGIRTGTFYGAYCRDLEGNKLCFFTM